MSNLAELSHSLRCLRNYCREWMLVKNFVPVDSCCRKSVMRLQRFFSPSTLNFTKLDYPSESSCLLPLWCEDPREGILLKFPSEIVHISSLPPGKPPETINLSLSENGIELLIMLETFLNWCSYWIPTKTCSSLPTKPR